MKLHLPFGLRKALLACLAAVAAHTLPFTVSTGSAAVSGAAIFSFLASQHVLAADAEDDEDAAISPIAAPDTSVADWGDAQDFSSGELTLTGSATITLPSAAGSITHAAEEDLNLKIEWGSKSTNQDALNFTYTGNGGFANVWLTGETQNARIANGEGWDRIQNLYIDGKGQVIFNTDATDLQLTLHLGTGSFDAWNNQFNNTVLGIVANVTTTGGLDLYDDSQITFEGGNANNRRTLTIGGAVTASGRVLTLNAYNNAGYGSLVLNNGGTIGSIQASVSTVNITLGGGTLTLENASSISGTLILGDNAELSLGANISVGSLSANGSLPASITKAENATGNVFVMLDSSSISSNTALSSWISGLDQIVFGEGAGIGKTGDNRLILTGGGAIGGNFLIQQGSVQFDGAAFTISGAVSGAGDLVVATAANDNGIYLTLSKGGALTGSMLLSEWGARVLIGDDLTVGGLEAKDGQKRASRNRYIGYTGESNATFTIDTAQGKASTIDNVSFDTGVNVVKDGEGSQTFTDSTFAGSVTVKKGSLSIGGTSSISGNLSVESGSSFTISDGKLTLTGQSNLINCALILGENAQLSFDVGGDKESTFSSTISGKLTGGDGSVLTLNSSSLTLSQGGSVYSLSLNGYYDAADGSHLKLGGNLEISAFSSGSTRHQISSATGEQVYLFFKTAGDNAQAQLANLFTNNNITINENVGFGKTGSATLSIDNASIFNNFAYDFKIAEGEMELLAGQAAESEERTESRTYSFQKTVQVEKGATLRVGAYTSTTLTGGLTGAGSLEMAGGSLVLGNGSGLQIGSLTLTADSALTLTGAAAEGGALDLGAFSASGGAFKLTITLTGQSSLDENWSYQLFKTGGAFSTDWWDLIADSISIDGLDESQFRLQLDKSSGRLSLVQTEVNDLRWQGSGDFTWGDSSENWRRNSYGEGSMTWQENKDVYFNSTNETDAIVVSFADGSISAGSMSVEGGSFIFGADGDSLILSGDLTVAEGAEALFGASLSLTNGAVLKGAGVFGVSGADVQWSATNAYLSSFTGKLKAANGATLILADDAFTHELLLASGGNLQLSAASATLAAGSHSAGAITLSGSAQLTLGSASLSLDSLQGSGTLIYSIGQNATTGSRLIIGESGISGDFTLELDFGSFTVDNLRDWVGKSGYSLFDVSDWSDRSDDWFSHFTLTGAPAGDNAWLYSLKLKADGRIVYTIDPGVVFEWNGSFGAEAEGYNKEFTWSADDQDTEWRLYDNTGSYRQDGTWVNEEDATVRFVHNTGASADHIFIDGAVSAGNVTFSQGSYVFHNYVPVVDGGDEEGDEDAPAPLAAPTDSLTFTGLLTIAEGASVEFGLADAASYLRGAAGGQEVRWYKSNVHLNDVDLQGSLTLTGSLEIVGNLTGSGNIILKGAESSTCFDLVITSTSDYSGTITFLNNQDNYSLPYDKDIKGRLRLAPNVGTNISIGGIHLGDENNRSCAMIEFTNTDQRIYINQLSGDGFIRVQGSNHSVAGNSSVVNYVSDYGKIYITGDSSAFKGCFTVYDDIWIYLRNNANLTIDGIRGWLGNYGAESGESAQNATLTIKLTRNVNEKDAAIFTFGRGLNIIFEGGDYTQILTGNKFYIEGVTNERYTDIESNLTIKSGTLSLQHWARLTDAEVAMEGGVLQFTSGSTDYDTLDTFHTITSRLSTGTNNIGGTLDIHGTTVKVITGGELGSLKFSAESGSNQPKLYLGGNLTLKADDKNGHETSLLYSGVSDAHIYRYVEPEVGSDATQPSVLLTIESVGNLFNTGTARSLYVHEGVDTKFVQDTKIGGTGRAYIIELFGESTFETSLKLYTNAQVHLGGDSTTKLLLMGDNNQQNGVLTIDTELVAQELQGTAVNAVIQGDGLFEQAWNGNITDKFSGSYSGKMHVDWLYSGAGSFEMKGCFGAAAVEADAEGEGAAEAIRKTLTITNGSLLFGSTNSNDIWSGLATIGSDKETDAAKTPTLEIGSTGEKHFSGIDLRNNGRLIVSDATGWTVDSAATQDYVLATTKGTLELKDLASGATNSSESMLNLLLGGSAGSNTLGKLELTGFTILTVAENSSLTAFNKVQDLLIDTNAKLVMNADNADSTSHNLAVVTLKGRLNLRNEGTGARIRASHLATTGETGQILITITGQAQTTGSGSKITLDTWKDFAQGAKLTIDMSNGSDAILAGLIKREYELFTGDWLEDVETLYQNWEKFFEVTGYDDTRYNVRLDSDGYLRLTVIGENDDDLYWDGGEHADEGRRYASFTWNAAGIRDAELLDWRLGPDGQYVDYLLNKNVHFTSLESSTTVSLEAKLVAKNMYVYRNAYTFSGSETVANSLTVDTLHFFDNAIDDSSHPSVTFKNTTVTVNGALTNEVDMNDDTRSGNGALLLDNATMNLGAASYMGTLSMINASTLNISGNFDLLKGLVNDSAASSTGSFILATADNLALILGVEGNTSDTTTDTNGATSPITRTQRGTLTIGSEAHLINVAKQGVYTQELSGLVTIYGDLTINEGAIRISNDSVTGSSVVQGRLSGKGSLIIGGRDLTVTGGGSIGSLSFAGNNSLIVQDTLQVSTLESTASNPSIELSSADAAKNVLTVESLTQLGTGNLTIKTRTGEGESTPYTGQLVLTQALYEPVKAGHTLTLEVGVELKADKTTMEVWWGNVYLKGGGTLDTLHTMNANARVYIGDGKTLKVNNLTDPERGRGAISGGTLELNYTGESGQYRSTFLSNLKYTGTGDFEFLKEFGDSDHASLTITLTNSGSVMLNTNQAYIGAVTIGSDDETDKTKTPTLIIHTDNSKSFSSSIDVKSNGTLRIDDSAKSAWTAAVAKGVIGSGSVELNGMTLSTGGDDLINNLFSNSDTRFSGTLKLISNTTPTTPTHTSLTVGASGITAFNEVSNISVAEKNTLNLTASNTRTTTAGLQKLELNGTLDLITGLTDDSTVRLSAKTLTTSGKSGNISIGITGGVNEKDFTGSKIRLDSWSLTDKATTGFKLTLADGVLESLIGIEETETTRYKLFEGDFLSTEGWESYFTLAGTLRDANERYEVRLNHEGYLYVVALADDLVWDGTQPNYTSFTWDAQKFEDSSDGITDWRLYDTPSGADGVYVDFTTARNVFFDSSQTGLTTVTLHGGIVAGNMTVEHGTYSFVVDTTDDGVDGIDKDTLTVNGMYLHGDANVTFTGTSVTVRDRLSNEIISDPDAPDATDTLTYYDDATLQLENTKMSVADGGSVGQLHMRGESSLTLGNDFTITDGFQSTDAAWNNAPGYTLTISNAHVAEDGEDNTITLTVNVTSNGANEKERQLWGNVTIGSTASRITLHKTGDAIQKFGHGHFELWGDVILENGELRFYSVPADDDAEKKSVIHGSLTSAESAGFLYLVDHSLTVEGKTENGSTSAGSLNRLALHGSTTLSLGGKFSVKTFTLDSSTTGIISLEAAQATDNTFTVTEAFQLTGDSSKTLTVQKTQANGSFILQKGGTVGDGHTLTLETGVSLSSQKELELAGKAKINLHGGGSVTDNFKLTNGTLGVGGTVSVNSMTDSTTGAIIFDSQNAVFTVLGRTNMTGELTFKGLASQQGGSVNFGSQTTIDGMLTMTGKMDITLGGNLSAAGLRQIDWDGAGGITISLAQSVSAAQLTTTTASSTLLWGDLTIDSGITLIKNGADEQAFGNGIIDIAGNVELQEGRLRFQQAKENTIIRGALSRGTLGTGDSQTLGTGWLAVANGILELAQGGFIYGLDMYNYSGLPTLTLDADLEVFEFGQNTQQGNIKNGTANAAKDVYLIWNVGKDGKESQNTDSFLNAYTYTEVGVGKKGLGKLTFTDGAGLATAKNFKIYEGEVEFTHASAKHQYTISGGFFGENDTTLTVGTAYLTLTKGGTTTGDVKLAGDVDNLEDTKLLLGDDLTAAGLLGSGGYVTLESSTNEADLILNVLTKHIANNVTIDSGVSLEKKGAGAQSLLDKSSFEGVHMTVEKGALTLHGSVTATGNVAVSGGSTLELTGDAVKEVKGDINVTGSGSVFTAQNLNQSTATCSTTVDGGSMSVAGKAKFAGNVSISQSGVLTLGGAAGDEDSVANGVISVDGEDSVLALKMHTWTETGMPGGITLTNGGRIRLAQEEAEFQTVNVATLHLGTVTLGETSGSLPSGILEWSTAEGNQEVYIRQLAGNGSLNVATFTGTDAYENLRHLHLNEIRDFSGSVTATYNGLAAANKLYVDSIHVSEGVAAGSISVTSSTDGDPFIYSKTFRKSGAGSFNLGSRVKVESGLWVTREGDINWAQGIQTYRQFELCDQVTLHYFEDGVTLSDKFELHSSLFSKDWQGIYLDIWGVKASMLEEANGGYYLGIVYDDTDPNATDIYSKLTDKNGYVNVKDVHLDNADVDFKILWKEEDGLQKLYLILQNYTRSDVLWDARWQGELATAPSEEEMNRHTYNADDKASQNIFSDTKGRTGYETSFVGQALELSATPQYLNTADGWAYIRLTAAENYDTTAYQHATVVGGHIYIQDNILPDHVENYWQRDINSYISYMPLREAVADEDVQQLGPVTIIDGKQYVEDTSAWLHLIVGGSSCVGMDTKDDGTTRRGGFAGNSHIQMDGGNVDYLVGGNHVNNQTFTFDGDSYISVFNGNVWGGIVGGSTLTRGANTSELSAFHGNSHIFIYAMLENLTDRDTPAISDGTAATDGADLTGESFTAIVGGNAWIDMASASSQTVMTPTFDGNSSIYIDLVNDQYKGSAADEAEHEKHMASPNWKKEHQFDKDIVGGNYTAIAKNGEDETISGNRNTLFKGNADIEIIAKDNDIFTGSINGASRRDSTGAGRTIFNGNASVRISGGEYQQAVAGGFWFATTAIGNHSSYLLGDTSVTIEDGSFRRVAGGSWSLGGAAAAQEVQVGSSSVSISGGSFEGGSPTDAQQISFVAGGDFYRDTKGSGHKRISGADWADYLAGLAPEERELLDSMQLYVPDNLEANTSVSIIGGKFSEAHIIGGDYANFTNAGNTPATAISGTSSVSITGIASSPVSITGLVAGGSYLYDEGAGGSVSVHKTEVSLSHATVDGEDQHDFHKELAVIGGHVVIDAGATAGGHYATVENQTHLTLGEGAVITGSVIGGSYANASDGENTLSTGSVSIEISGNALITGSVYGGHYTESTTTPDSLRVGDISITMIGGGVTSGNIVGGGYRLTTSDSDGNSTHGAISIDLLGGVLEAGSVFAAGYNGGNGTGSALTVAASTHITIHEDFTFIPNGQDIYISGGYGRADASVRRGSITGDATLTFTGANSSINMNASLVHLQDANIVDVQSGTIKVDTPFFVLSGKEDLTKNGEGMLRVARLTTWDKTDTTEATDHYTGHITVDDGYLALTGADGSGAASSQDLAGGLSVNLSKYETHYHDRDHAYLQNHDNTDGHLFVSNGKARVDLTGVRELNGHMYYGLYYLATGLDTAITRDNKLNYFAYDLSELENSLNAGEVRYWLDVQVLHNSLVLRVRHTYEKTGWWWEGDSDNVWEDLRTNWEEDLTYNWSQQLTQQDHYSPDTAAPDDTDGVHHAFKLTPRGKDVHFAEGALETTVQINSEVAPRSVWVEGEQYVFTGTGRLSIGSDAEANEHDSDLTQEMAAMRLSEGALAVGGKFDTRDGSAVQKAELTLGVATSAAAVRLMEKGTLVLAHDIALDAAASITFEGGALAYGADGKFSTDLSAQVDAAGSGDNLLRLRIGDTGRTADEDRAYISADPQGAGVSILWGSAAATRELGGISLALDNGLVKTGVGSLEFTWSAAADETVNGSMKALEGTLTYRRAGAGAATLAQADAADNIEVAEGAKLIFETMGGAGLDIARALEGGGHAVIGSATAQGQNYTLRADNSALTGVLELLGDSAPAADSLVTLTQESALGGADTTLRLAGRHFRFSGNAAAGEKSVTVKQVQVVDGSTTYVGGILADAANEHITLNSQLVQTDASGSAAASDHSGVIANAWGAEDGSQAFRHTIVGDLAQYRGLILAGAAATKGISALSAAVPGGSASTWTLTSDAKTTQTLSLTLGGAGSFIFAYGADVRLTGQIGTEAYGALNALTSLQNATNGHTVYIVDGDGSDWAGKTGKNIATGALSGVFQLGDAETFGSWAGTLLAADADVTLVNGFLKNAMTKAADTALLSVHTAYTDAAADDTLRNASTRVDVGGTLGSMFNAITITAGGQMLGVNGDITVDGAHTVLNLTFGAGNVARSAETADRNMIVGQSAGSASLTLTQDGLKDTTLNIDNTAFRSALIAALGGRNGQYKSYLHVLGNGEILLDSSLNDGDLLKKVQGDNTDLLDWLNFTATAEGGDIVLQWQKPADDTPPAPPELPREIYLVIDEAEWGTWSDAATVDGYGVLNSHFKATFVDDAHTLTLNLNGQPGDQTAPVDDEDLANGLAKDVAAGGAVVNNLVGLQTARFLVNNTGADRVNVILHNAQYTYPNPATGDDGIRGGEDFHEQGVYGIDTQFWGDIIAGAGVDMVKTGEGRLTVGFDYAHTGSLQLRDGTFSLQGGALTLTGTGNSMGALRFARAAATAADEDVLLKHGATSIGSIVEENAAALSRRGGDIALQDGAMLTLTGESAPLVDSTISHRSGNTAELQLAKGGRLQLTDSARITGLGLVLEDGGLLSLGSTTASSVAGLTGAGELGGTGAHLSVTGNMSAYTSRHREDAGYAFSGSLTGTGNLLTIEKDAWLLLRNAAGGDGWAVDNNGELILDLGTAAGNTALGDITLRSGSSTTLIVNTDLGSCSLPTLHGGQLTVEKGAHFTLDSTGKEALQTEEFDGGTRFGVAWVTGNRRELDNAEWTTGVGLLHTKIEDKYIEDGVLWLVLSRQEDNRFTRPGFEKNPQAGADLMWDATDESKNDKWKDMKDDPSSDMAGIAGSLLEQEKKQDWDGMQSTLAAVAGASTSALGMAAIEDMHRQLRTTRNRSVTSSSERCWNGVDCPTLLHAYIMGEGNYHKMNADSYAPGFTFSNWGGTVGMDVDINRHGTDSTNLGLSLTAMYGNLTVDAADRAKGDLDTQYLTAFGRITKGKWQHTLVLSAGLMDLTLNRTVNYGTGAYTTHGSTDGYALGALYEIGYNAFTNEAGTKCLQFVANAEARRIELDGYTERSSSDAALHVGDITQEVFTFGLGARYRSVVGYNVWNRASTFEARILAKADVGDRSGKVSNALINGTSRREEVESAKLGVFGVEAGTGITIPCGRCGSFFIDASVELRNGYLNADANAGYRMTF